MLLPGSEWHPDLKIVRSHLLISDLPRFMMDSYEECRDPPNLDLLDKFDCAGSGACLKRYSDPSYFKRVWATTELELAEKVKRKNKDQIFNRKGSRVKNGEVQCGVSISQPNSRQFKSPSNVEHFSAETTPSSDMKLEDELASRSTSFDSRTRFNYGTQVPDTNSSVMPMEHARLSDSKLQINQHDIHELNEVSRIDGSPHGSLKAKSSCRSASVTWDEKSEILMSASPRSSDGIVVASTGHFEPLTISKQSNVELETAIKEAIDRGNNMYGKVNVQPSLSGVPHSEEVTSETDNYMDALNTLESETETDSECQTKREVKSFSDVKYPEIVSRMPQMQEMASQSSEISSVDPAAGSHNYSIEDGSPDNNNLMPSKSLELLKLPHLAGSISDPNCCIGNLNSEHNAVDMPRMSSFKVVQDDQPSKSSICSSPTIWQPSIDSDVSKSPVSPSKISSIPSPKFWTNGGLFGLEPSKPPDFSVSKLSGDDDIVSDPNISGSGYNYSSQEPRFHNNWLITEHMTVSSSDENLLRSPHSISRTDGLPRTVRDQSNLSGFQQFGGCGNVVSQVDLLQNSPFLLDDQHDVVQANQNSQRHFRDLSFVEFKKLRAMNTNSNAQNRFGATVPGVSELSTVDSIESQPNRSGQNTVDISSSLSAIAQRIITGSLQRKSSISPAQYGDVNADIITSNLQGTSLLKNHKKGPIGIVSGACNMESVNNIESISPLKSIGLRSQLSGNSSPPLEHMKLSFHPMNCSETSKLRLEYACDNDCESIEDLTFPSFQLLPGPNIPLEDYIYETDDDSFCKSCLSTTEDHLSPHSVSNSELWEHGEMSEGRSHELYNDLHIFSLSSPSVSCFEGFDKMCQIDALTGFEDLEAENGNSVGLPGYDSLSIDPEGSTSQYQKELPPLPPVQWRMTNASLEKEEEKKSNVAKIVEHFNVLQEQRVTARRQQEVNIPRPPSCPEKLASPMTNSQHDAQNQNRHEESRGNDVSGTQQHGREELFIQIQNQKGQHMMNGQKEPEIHGTDGQLVDERQDLLYQIKNKTFNLRSTSSAKPSFMPQPNKNNNVAAILEKANAIRQAFVGSDDGGDDDNWSDS